MAAELEGRVRDVAHGGDSVVETAEGIVMTRGALPGERVRLRTGKRRGGVRRAELLEVLEASPERRDPACALADRCGGCPLMALAPDAQLALKRRRLEGAVGDGPAPAVEMTPAPATLGYRGRARLAFDTRGGRRTLGYHAAASRKLVDVPSCPILDPALDRALSEVRVALLPTLAGRGELSLGSGSRGRAVVHVRSDAAQPADLYGAAEGLVERGAVAGAALAIAGAAPARFGEPRQQTCAPDGTALWAAPDGFAQANPAVNRDLVAAALELSEAEGATVLELYAGHGNFTAGLAARARKLSAVESDRAAADACRSNLASLGLSKRARVRCDPAEVVGSTRGPVDVILLDPPRTGAREALPGIIGRKPRRIVYVSCDPATLRRDLAPLREAGYRVGAVCGFDMFPHTPHVEAVVRLTR